MISPSINIGIGKDGIFCLHGLASIFDTRESDFPALMSFLTINLEGGKRFNTFNRDSKRFENYNLPDKIDAKVTENHVFLATAYNDLISIINVLYENLQYTYININLVYSALEADLSIVEELGDIVQKYTQEGTFGTVVIKNYIIISDGNGILTTDEENLITTNLSFIERVRANSKIVDSIFVLDDKNLNAVFLGYKHEYLSFALYEFLIALMTNQYKLISNLPGRNNLLSFGIGSIFFDKLYFNSFFDYKIFNTFLKNESISDESIDKYDLSFVDSVKSTFIEFFENPSTELSGVFNEVNLQSSVSQSVNIGSYLFTLQLMLGIREDRIVNTDDWELRYSIKDLIFNIIYNYVLDDKNDVVSVEMAKSEYVKHFYQQQELEELKSLEENNYEVEIKALEEREELTNSLLTRYEKQLELSFFKYKRPMEIKDLKLNQLQELKERLEDLRKKLEVAKYIQRKKGFFGRLFSGKSFKLEVAEINFDIEDVENEIKRKEKSTVEIQNALQSLYKLYDLCMEHGNRIESIVVELQKRKVDLHRNWSNTPYIDYSFVQNIIDLDLIKQYFKKHKATLTKGVKLSLNKLLDYEIEVSTLKEEYIHLAEDNRKEIVDFDIADYMLGAYDSLELFTTFNFHADIKKLRERGRPFINVVPSYVTQTHELFSIHNSLNKEKVFDKIKNYYASAIPLSIDCPNRDRFLSINIESIVSVSKIAKSSKKEIE